MGERVKMRKPGSHRRKEKAVRILYVTRSGYCHPGRRVRTSLVGVSDQDWALVFKRDDAGTGKNG